MVITTLVYGEDLNLFAANINTRKEKRENIFVFSKNVGPELNNEKIKDISYGAGQSHNIKIANKAFENVLNFKYLMIA
jgi:hypothetical protein